MGRFGSCYVTIKAANECISFIKRFHNQEKWAKKLIGYKKYLKRMRRIYYYD
jgi:hypothetical protein